MNNYKHVLKQLIIIILLLNNTIMDNRMCLYFTQTTFVP